MIQVSKKMKDLKKEARGSQDPLVNKHLTNALAAFDTVTYIRQLNFSNGFAEYLEKQGVKVITKNKPWPGGATEMREFIDDGRTQKENPQHNIQALFWEFKAHDEIHWPVVEAMQAGKRTLDCV
jgi:hypothetical protein